MGSDWRRDSKIGVGSVGQGVRKVHYDSSMGLELVIL